MNESQFGALTSCNKCGGVYFLGWDGKPEAAPAADSMEDVAETKKEISKISIANTPIDNYESNSFEQSDIASVAVENSFQQESNFATQENFEPSHQESYSENSNFDVDQPLDSFQNNSYGEAGNYSQEPQKENFNDLIDFGNSSDPGVLSYVLTIDGIDLQSIEDEIKQILSESRFQFDVELLLSNLKNGQLVIDNLSPIKASILVHRLRFLSVTLSWRQNAIG